MKRLLPSNNHRVNRRVCQDRRDPGRGEEKGRSRQSSKEEKLRQSSGWWNKRSISVGYTSRTTRKRNEPLGHVAYSAAWIHCPLYFVHSRYVKSTNRHSPN